MKRFIGTERSIETAGAMQAFGAELAGQLEPGQVLLLHGDLGAGKTTLSQGIARGLGIDQPVTSPTFTLVAEYVVDPPMRGIERLYHLDLYRLTDPAELETIGFEEFLDPERGITVIEWPERAEGFLPDGAVVIELNVVGTGARSVSIRRLGEPSS